MNNIVITNYNSVSACGIGNASLKRGVIEKKDYLTDINLFEAKNFDIKRAFQVEIDFQAFLGKGGLKHINRNAKLAMVCIETLIDDFKDLPESEKPPIIFGSAFGSVDSIAEFMKVSLTEGFAGLRPLDFPNTTINSSGSFLNIRYGLTNASVTVCNGYNSSLDAFIYASDYINLGYAKNALVGGGEEFGEYQFIGQLKSGFLSYEKHYNIGSNCGYFPGEGSAFFVVESIESAKSLNKNVIAELVGFSSKYGKNPDIYTECYKEALSMAKITPKDLYLISSGINGVRNERFFLTYQKTFQDCKHIPIVTNKEVFGECYGASGALQIASVLASDLENVKDKYFAVDNFSIDGNNCVLIFKT